MNDPARSPAVDAHHDGATGGDDALPRFTGWLRPAVDAVARMDSGIHRKLLIGFLTGALLLVGMAGLSLVVISQMNERMNVLNAEAVKVDRAQQMLYDVTAQSHYRAMALLTYRSDPAGVAEWNAKVEDKKSEFAELLTALEQADPADADFYQRLRTDNQRYAEASAKVLAAFQQGDVSSATTLHLTLEHPASHVIEDLLANCPTADNPCFPRFGVPFIQTAQQEMSRARDAFQSDRGLLSTIVIAFSAVSVLVALLLGFALSWAFILPVRKMKRTLAEITAGNFDHRVHVPNRDEFGRLGQDLNITSERLKELFDTQRSLTHRLGETNASLARASEAKSSFLASVSHELRTPMNAILGFTDALLAGVDGPLNEEQRESLGWVQRGGRDLLGLINQILDLSKIEAGKLTLDPQPFDAAELVESVVEQHRPLAAEKGIGFSWLDTGAPPEVVLDRQRVRQILVNLLGNALKFTSEGGVDVSVGSTSDGRLHVAVRDTGPGIEGTEHEAIFEEFRQAGTGAAGTGLGLAISRRLARAMGGDVTLDSEPGRGSVFHLVLPLDCHPTSASPRSSELDDLPAGGRLLLSVDDDPSVAPLLEKMLAGSGYRVMTASPDTAVRDADRLRPAVILLDLLMPGRSGEDVLRELKADPATRAIPLIVMSVVDSADVPADADAYLRKPVDNAVLLAALADAASSKVEP